MHRCSRSDYDIRKVYSYKLPTREPLVSIHNLELEKILHVRNFWQRHLINPHEDTFYSSFRDLPASQRPKAWHCPLGEGKELKSLWLGYYCT